MKINEASNLTPLEKMIKFEHYLKTGESSGAGRREAINLCRIDKLIDFYKICIDHNLTKASIAIEHELVKRGRPDIIQSVNNINLPKQSTTTNTRPLLNGKSLSEFIGGFSEDEFESFTAVEIRNQYVKGNRLTNENLKRFEQCLYAEESSSNIHYLMRFLIYSIILHHSADADIIFNFFVDHGVKSSDIKQVIAEIQSNQKIVDKLNEIQNSINESLKEDIKLEKTTPYMLRNDGALLMCGEIHPYIKMQYNQPFNVTLETLRMNSNFLDWFYTNSLNDEIKELSLKVKDELDSNSDTLEADIILLNDLTNQEFCRVRTSNFKYKYGGDNGEIYFRISSEGFNWFDLIWNTVNRFKSQIKFVTIMKDYAATGERFSYIHDDEHTFNKMPIDEFLTLSGNPVVENLDENIEKHNELNPKLWNEDNTLKTEVDEKINQIVDEFISDLHEDEINIKIDDIILVGSNCSYNYTESSDLDIHIIANAKESNYPPEYAEKLYSAYRTIFNKTLDIAFYDIPVEIYVETENSELVSNGIYSVMNRQWIKEPVAENIPEIDQEVFEKDFKVWEDRYNNLIKTIRNKSITVDGVDDCEQTAESEVK